MVGRREIVSAKNPPGLERPVNSLRNCTKIILEKVPPGENLVIGNFAEKVTVIEKKLSHLNISRISEFDSG
jgi:hypothetical protein